VCAAFTVRVSTRTRKHTRAHVQAVASRMPHLGLPCGITAVPRVSCASVKWQSHDSATQGAAAQGSSAGPQCAARAASALLQWQLHSAGLACPPRPLPLVRATRPSKRTRARPLRAWPAVASLF
jgi:hypothetical protein